MSFISPKQLDDDPKLFLSIPHELHKMVIDFQDMILPGFKQKLIDQKIHCLECDGEDAFAVFNRVTGKTEEVVGYIGDKKNPESFRTEPIDEEVIEEITKILSETLDA